MNDSAGPAPEFPQGGQGRQPVFNLPGILTASILLLIAIYVVQVYVLSDELREKVFMFGAFVPARYIYPLSEQGLEWFTSPVTYSLLHGGIEHLGFNCLWLAAFGAPVVRRIGALRFLVYWLVSSIASALLFLVLHWGEVSLLIGASGVISALMGSACRFAFPPEEGRIGGPVHLLPLLSVTEALRSGTVRVFILMWFVGNLIFALGIPLLGDIGAVAWEAHIGGFVFGFFLFPLFDPLRRRRARF
ncbi:MAG: rhomboid family intramembrane serine protease [Rhizobiales bacterium 63-7]|uniref:rhomboid family intramembrane serine protease n=1 Tax=Rhizobium sp. YJ-22 TaxID=3037556 RepID=UPI00092C1C99|nr:rhomboid family intramembrane serine protease [Rhizobium sp. YJ-22]MBN9030610.1 rhomboid family intramembrane serine protease [Hyphomicrobiales bacterium]MDG3578698.1 rhomboid family intramembrane serine protease [Rhizobium sp. YJ-22]OJU72045.1 MAG: rhomboid family intramembrane serine protease [Rhizobiales bacterium 63-7]